jgi:hypothetical protein
MSNRAGLIAVAVVLMSAAAASADLGPPGRGPGQNDARAWAGVAVICIGAAIALDIMLKVLVILYIVRDARRRAMNPLPWIIVAVFAEVIALIIYLCVRQPLRPHVQDTGD